MSEAPATAAAIEQLARRAAEGDDVAFGRLVREVRPLLLRWALVQTRDSDDAEDVVQAALLRLHRGLGSFQRGSRFTTWLFAVLRSAAADWRRAARRRGERDFRYAGDVVRHVPPVDHTDRGRLLALVRSQLDGLPARQREVFDLADLQGHAPVEVAAMLRMNHNTVRAHLLRARRTLRAHILATHAQLLEET